MTHLEKMVELLYTRDAELADAIEEAGHYKYQTERCHDYIRHLSHELDVVKNVKRGMSGDDIKSKLRQIFQATSGHAENDFFSEVECVSAFIEAHFEQKKEPEATHPVIKADEGLPMEMLSWSAGQLARFVVELEGRIKGLKKDESDGSGDN